MVKHDSVNPEHPSGDTGGLQHVFIITHAPNSTVIDRLNQNGN